MASRTQILRIEWIYADFFICENLYNPQNLRSILL